MRFFKNLLIRCLLWSIPLVSCAIGKMQDIPPAPTNPPPAARPITSTSLSRTNKATSTYEQSPEQYGKQEALRKVQAIKGQKNRIGVPSGYFTAERYLQGITVTTSPLLGLRSAYSAADLLYQYPSMNEDLILLGQRRNFEYFLQEVGGTLNNRPIVVLSGGVEGQIIYAHGFGGRNGNDVNLTTADLDVFAMISTWANSFMAFSFNSSAPETGSRVANSVIFLSRGFLTIGNLAVTPFYFTIGQMYVPFGKYDSALLSTPLTKTLARILARAALLGVYKNGFYAQVYGFRGDRINGSRFLFKQGGLNVGYESNKVNIGAGIVSHMAASQGMQNNGINPIERSFIMGTIRESLTQFGGFAVTPGGDLLAHNFPAADFNMKLALGRFGLSAEYITGFRRFASQDATFNFKGALVRALSLELDINFKIRNTDVLLAFYGGQTWQALAFNVPQNSIAVVVSTSIWKNTMTGLEYRHDTNYRKKELLSATGHKLPVPFANVGGTRDIIILQFGAYF
jgi:hypothetical protein